MEIINGLYLDTNVFIAMAEGATALSGKLYDFVRSQRPGHNFLFTSELSLAELLVYPLRHQEKGLVRLYDGWLTSGGWSTVVSISRPILLKAAYLRAQYATIKLPDAIHLSTAIEAGCTHFLTADKRLPERISLRADAEEIASRIVLTVLPLNSKTIGDITEGRRSS